MEASKRFEGTRGRVLRVSGWLATLAVVALLSPGVEWVRAESTRSDAAEEIAAGPSCQAGPAANQVPADLIRRIEQARTQAAARLPSTDDEFVYLNNRGFNYEPNPLRDAAHSDSID